MSKTVSALFIGGPWDGRRVALPEAMDHFRVACEPELRPEFTEPVSNLPVRVDYATYPYKRLPLYGGAQVWVPEEWFDRRDASWRGGPDPVLTRTLSRLINGYVGDLS